MSLVDVVGLCNEKPFERFLVRLLVSPFLLVGISKLVVCFLRAPLLAITFVFLKEIVTKELIKSEEAIQRLESDNFCVSQRDSKRL
mmetsp:Transcript_10555/g.30914  ORF Transcript_10555/g.30914 Transcript_10555/m.30914 type:complete len:86 (+) Transcript_10555:1622-1879(+)